MISPSAKDFSFTSESVSVGHPDKMADQISDAIVDGFLKADPNAYLNCETLIKTGLVLIAGEVNASAHIEIDQVVRNAIEQIGYTDSKIGFDAKSCAILDTLGNQSQGRLSGKNESKIFGQESVGQGIVFGYAADETDVLMPAPIRYAHLLMQKQSQLRKDRIIPWLWPNAKTQITFQYENNEPVAISHLVVSIQHEPEISQETIKETAIEAIIKAVIPNQLLKNTIYFINPIKRLFIEGGCGLTGRKTIVDSYGGMARQGGGCFSGKDPSKIVRTGAYIARYIAKNIVASKIAKRCEIQIAYASGDFEPINLQIETFGTSKWPNKKLLQMIHQIFPLKRDEIIQSLQLSKPIYQATACYGHFGREDLHLPWEAINKIDNIRNF